MKVGDLVCYKGDRSALGSIAKLQGIDYGGGRIIQKAMVIWLTGNNIGKKSLFDERDLVLVKD